MREECFDDHGNYFDPESGEYFDVATGGYYHECDPGADWPPRWLTWSANGSGASINCEGCARLWPERTEHMTDERTDVLARTCVDFEFPNVRFINLEALDSHRRRLRASEDREASDHNRPTEEHP